MWSSCPCVSTIASRRSAFCRTYSKSGSTRSMPCMSVVGNDRPTSTTRRRSASSTPAMLRPTSPTPPRKTTRQRSALEETGVLQCLADPSPLLLVRGNERQARLTRRPAHHLERGLQGDRVARHEEGVEQRRQRFVD